MKATINFKDAKKEKMPKTGAFFVVYMQPQEEGEPVEKMEIINIIADPIGPINVFGEVFGFKKQITHWAEIPSTVDAE